ncbi:hypothetical protein J4409_00325 [Candidatus Woesearchaeota archaeon]|nr:hypothetical protein [Candidatus Woesearchaeota archaeon]
MNDYIFILGRDFQLSLLELVSYFISRRIEYKIKFFNKNLALISLPELDFNSLINKLGGTVKIARVINSISDIKIPNFDKIKYSITEFESKNKEKIMSELKKIFKKEKIKAFFKTPDEGIGVSPSDFFNQNFFKQGFELILFKDIIALTIAVFNPKEYEKRDERPYLQREGITSIRIAKILINLSQAKERDVLLDPFCGSATILQEALLMDINVIGMDIDSRSIFFARKNLTWLKNKYKFKTDFTLINKAAQSSSSYIEKVDAVATEFLGPSFNKTPFLKDTRRIAANIASIYSGLFEQLRIILKGGKIAIALPKFKTKEQVPVSINLVEIAKFSGFKLYNPFPTIQLPILYSSRKTKIQREIYIFEKV